MRRPVQRKYAAKAAHGSRGGQGKMTLPCPIVQTAMHTKYSAGAEGNCRRGKSVYAVA